ncbi:MAG TPA: hypothetical protein VGI96_21980 [Streptosporangiaceae bacterium]
MTAYECTAEASFTKGEPVLRLRRLLPLSPLMMFVGVGPGSPGLHHPSFLPPDDAVVPLMRWAY